MKLTTLGRPVFSILLTVFAATSTLAKDELTLDLGQLEFPNSGASAAQDSFLKGTLLLHSFEYVDAAEEYRNAQQIDPDFALAYWGEAMTCHHTLWREHDRDKAQKILARLAPTRNERLKKARTEKEKGLLNSVEILFGEGTRRDRIIAYSKELGRLHERFPKDLEITAFYSISILGTSFDDRNFTKYMKAGAVAEEVYAQNPDHPGGLHYLIHSYDDPIHAPLGMRAARRYATIAPAATHALHMPSHIFFALGLWDRVVASNEDSSAAADARMRRKELSIQARGYHSLSWLSYGYLQQGRVDDACRLLQDMVKNERQGPSARTQVHLASMRAAFVIEAERYSGEEATMEIPSDKTGDKTKVTDLFARGFALAQKNQIEPAAALLAEIDGIVGLEPIVPGPPVDSEMCCAPPTDAGESKNNPKAYAIMRVLQLELRGLIELKSGNPTAAEKTLTRAVEIESELSFYAGPPVIVKPSFELLGEVYLALKRPKEALNAFQKSLKRAPNRTLSLRGSARASEAIDRKP